MRLSSSGKKTTKGGNYVITPKLVNPKRLATVILMIVISLAITAFCGLMYYNNLIQASVLDNYSKETKLLNKKVDLLLDQQLILNKEMQEYKQRVYKLEKQNAERQVQNEKYINFISNWNSSNAETILSCMDSAYKEFRLESYGLRFSTFVAQANVESKYNIRATGSRGDIGLYQILPRTAYSINSEYFKISGFTPQMLYNPKLNARFSAYYLKSIFDRGYGVGDTLESYNKWIYKGVKSRGYRDRVFEAERSII